MTIRLPNRTGQEGVYKTGSPNYVDVDHTSAALTGMVTFATKVTDDSWLTDDLVSILIKKDNSNYKVWLAQWDGTNEYLKVVTEEETVGTISDSDAVDVVGVPTTKIFDKAIFEVQTTGVAGTTYTILATDKGKQICCTSSSAVTITLDDALPVDFNCSIVQEGTGNVALISSGTDTINGIQSRIYLQCRYRSAYVYQRIEGTWIALVGPPYGVINDPYWDNVVLSMNMEGANAGTLFYDFANTPHTFSISGTSITTSTTQKKWGVSAAYTNNTGKLIATALGGDELDGDFTIECWVYQATRDHGGASDPGWIGWGDYTAGISLHMRTSSPANYLACYINNSLYTASASAIPLTEWVHLAIVRSGSSVMGFLNGVKYDVATTSETITPSGSNIRVMGWTGTTSTSVPEGYLDAVRVTKGIARYTANFDHTALLEYQVHTTAGVYRG